MVNIALIGFMGSGKTTVGRVLANRLKYTFIDTDRFIEEITGRTIPAIFESGGEEGFRAIESAALEEVLAGEGQVVSCGGGIVLREENRARLAERAFVVYLTAQLEEIFRRVGDSGHKRPLLDVGDPKAEVERLLKEREPLYMAVADSSIDTTGISADDIVDRIVSELHARNIQV